MAFHEDNNSVTELSNQCFYIAKIAYPEDIPLLEAYDEQHFTLSDGMFHIESPRVLWRLFGLSNFGRIRVG